MNIKFSFNKWQIISGIFVLVLFIMTLIMYLVIGLKFSNSEGSFIFAGFGEHQVSTSGNSLTASLNFFRNMTNAKSGKDIYGSAAAIIAFVTILVVTVFANGFIPTTKMIWKKISYVGNYLFLFLILILSSVIIAEYFSARDFIMPGGSLSVVTLIFLFISGLLLPLLSMGFLFDKTLFKAILKRENIA